MDRTSWLLSGVGPDDRLLEVGPSHSPIAPKAAGWRTHVVDHAPLDDLRTKYALMGVDVSAIEPVDSVWAGGALHESVPIEFVGTFKRLIASHVIEHIPDFVRFFESATRLLAPGGVVVLAVPDKRHCFDFFKPLSATGDVLESHALARVRHARRTVWNQIAYSVAWRGAGAWGDENVSDLTFTGSLEAAVHAFSGYDDGPEAPYTDCHAWQFTPARFQLVMLELGQLGVLDWHVAELKSAGAEFLCKLQQGVECVQTDELQRRRLELLYRGLSETREQVDLALGGRRVQDLEQRLREVSQERDALLASTSWRATMPLRRLSRLVRGGADRLRPRLRPKI